MATSGDPNQGEELHPGFAYELGRVTEQAAIAAAAWIGRGQKQEGDAAAVLAMRRALDALPIDARVVIGEGEDRSRGIHRGEHLGTPGTYPADVAVDPVEGTSYLAKGLTNALATAAVAPRGALFDPGPCFYMQKLVAPAAAAGVLDPEAPVAEQLWAVAVALGRSIGSLTVYVLEKPRHRPLVAAIHAAGAKVALYPAGDVAGALLACLPDSGIDVLMGTGGTPEGVLAACGVRALGGAFFGRLDPQLEHERRAVAAAGVDVRTWHDLGDLVRSQDVFFSATGITSGLLVEGVTEDGVGVRTQTFLTIGATGRHQVITSSQAHPRSAAADAVPREGRSCS